MTLMQVISAVEAAAMRQKSLRMIVRNDIFRLNTYADARYGVFGWTQGQHSGSAADDLMSWSFTFFYVDRLTEDGGNETEVQSVGIETLRNIIAALRGAGLEADSWTFETFTQRFMDECAGVFCSVTLTAPIGWTCEETWPDFRRSDFNKDFLII